MKKLLIPLLLLLSALFLFACGDDTPGEDDTVRVMVTLTDGISVNGPNPVDVKRGESVEFDVTLAEGYVFSSVSHGSFDEKTGKLRIDSVTQRTTVSFTLEYLDYDLSAEYIYSFFATDRDTTTLAPTQKAKAGTAVMVEAGDSGRIFLGWSIGKSLEAGGELVSEARTFSFRISPSLARDGAVLLYANYADSNKFYYHPNGGYVNSTTTNMASNDYYTATVEDGGERVEIELTEHYYSFAESACTFWDDGTFYRYGYVLKEYNTSPDGTGEGYSLGSKFFPVINDEHPTLYCIWERATDSGEFEYSRLTMPKPTTATHADGWITEGVVITKYLGDESTVCIPEQIDGSPVIAIASGAFTNKRLATLILPKTIQRVEDGALVGCSCLDTLYYPNGIYEISDDALDAESYSSLKSLIVNATIAPRFTTSTDGGFAVKLSRFLAALDEKKIIIISGSSTYQGLATEYMEALFGGEYTVINFGTTRPRPGLIYLEALSHFTDSDDIFVYAPENSAFMMGERLLNWRMIRDLEGMSNLFRYVDISNYEGYFSAFAELNRDYNYKTPALRYEQFVDNGYYSSGNRIFTDKNGDYQHYYRREYENKGGYVDAYYVTFNNRFKSIDDLVWNDVEGQAQNKNWRDETNPTWTSIDRPELIEQMNMAIGKAKASGARVYFGFCPVDEYAVIDEAKNRDWLAAYDAMLDENYDFDGILGSCADYIYSSEYFYDCAFHVNDYGRVYRTYNLYRDIAEAIGITDISGIYSVGTHYDGCVFEDGATDDGTPVFGVDFLS